MKFSKVTIKGKMGTIIFVSVVLGAIVISGVTLVAQYVGQKSADIKKFTAAGELARIERDQNTIKVLRDKGKLADAEELLTGLLDSVRCDTCEIKAGAAINQAKGKMEMKRTGVTDLQLALDPKFENDELHPRSVEDASEAVYKVVKVVAQESDDLKQGRNSMEADPKFGSIKELLGKFTTPVLRQLIATVDYAELTADKTFAVPSKPLGRSLYRVIAKFVELSELDGGVPAFLPLEIVKIAKSTIDASLEPDQLTNLMAEVEALKTQGKLQEELGVTVQDVEHLNGEQLAELYSKNTQFRSFELVLHRAIEIKKEAAAGVMTELALVRAYTEQQRDDIVNNSSSVEEGKKRWLEKLDLFIRCLFGRLLTA